MPVNPTRTAKATIVDFRRVDDEIIVRRRIAIHYAESANGANDAHIVDVDMADDRRLDVGGRGVATAQHGDGRIPLFP